MLVFPLRFEAFTVVEDEAGIVVAVVAVAPAASVFFLVPPLLRCFGASPASLLSVVAVWRAFCFLGAFAGAEEDSSPLMLCLNTSLPLLFLMHSS